MQRFAQLFHTLDTRSQPPDQIEALCQHWAHTPPADAAWAVYLLTGGRLRRLLTLGELRRWAPAWAGVDDWLFEASHQAVGDLAETIAHLLPPPDPHTAPPAVRGLSAWMHTRLLPAHALPPPARPSTLKAWCDELEAPARLVLLKLVTGTWRTGVSRQTVIQSLAWHAGLPPTLVAERMQGYTDTPTHLGATDFERLIAPCPEGASQGIQPLPFSPAHALVHAPQDLGPPSDWLVEWKLDGLRAQCVRRDGRSGVWLRHDTLGNDAFPDLIGTLQAWPDGTVLDGEILPVQAMATPARAAPEQPDPAWPLPFRPAPLATLHKRLQRQRIGPSVLAECPVRFVPHDVLVWQGQDLRDWPQHQRRALLEQHAAPACGLAPSPRLSSTDWQQCVQWHNQARARGMQGLMLKRRDARYGAAALHHAGHVGHTGPWLAWKLEPMTVDAVLLYAKAAPARHAGTGIDGTFAVWSRAPRDEAEATQVAEAIATRQPPQTGGLQLVTFTQALIDLGEDADQALAQLIRQTTVDKFGPVRSLRPTQVFELGFEGIAPSARHKCGLTLRAPRVLRWHPDAALSQAGTLDELRHRLP